MIFAASLETAPFKTLLVFPVDKAAGIFANDTTLVITGVVSVLAEGSSITAVFALEIFTDKTEP